MSTPLLSGFLQTSVRDALRERAGVMGKKLDFFKLNYCILTCGALLFKIGSKRSEQSAIRKFSYSETKPEFYAMLNSQYI